MTKLNKILLITGIIVGALILLFGIKEYNNYRNRVKYNDTMPIIVNKKLPVFEKI